MGEMANAKEVENYTKAKTPASLEEAISIRPKAQEATPIEGGSS